MMKMKAREIDWHGISRIVAAGGGTLSPDKKTFYVAQSVPQVAIWQAFPEEINKRVQ